MKLDDKDFNVKQLDVDYERSEFKRYEGEVPRTGTILIYRVTKMWWTYSSDGTSAMKTLAVAEKNNGSKAEYNGLPTWDFLTFKPEAAFRYMPFLETFGLKLRDIKSKMIVADEDDNIGTPITAIGDWEVGSDDALCKIVVKNDKEYGAKVDREGWLEYEPEEEEEERPTRRGRSTPAPARGAKAASSRTRPEPEPEEEDEYDDDDEEEEYDEEAEEDEEEEAPPARPARRSSQTSSRTASRTSTTRTAARGRSGSSASANRAADRDRRGRGSDEEPPF
jgi:hypothetical protein